MLSLLFLFGIVLGIGLAKPTEQQTSSTSALQTCLEQLSTKVCDPSGVLSQEQMQKLNDALDQMEKQTQQEGYAFDKTQREKCGQKGVTMPIVLLKEDTQDLSTTERMLVEMNKQWTLKHQCDRVAIMMLNTAEKIEQRRFWAGRNWNVNVEPAEMVKLYQQQIPLIQKADYMQALLNILQQFTQMISKRNGPPADQKVIQQKAQQPSASSSGTTGEQKGEMVKAEESSSNDVQQGQQQQTQQNEQHRQEGEQKQENQ